MSKPRTMFKLRDELESIVLSAADVGEIDEDELEEITSRYHYRSNYIYTDGPRRVIMYLAAIGKIRYNRSTKAYKAA